MKLKWDKDGIKTPLARARGLGSAHAGVGHWWHERITALALIPLSLWLVLSIISMKGASHGEFTTWLAHPFNAILMVLFILIAFYHAALGCRVIAEDYIQHEGLKTAKIIGIELFFLCAGTACVFAVLKIAL
ncbi:MAG: succinate dehydrogenase, hydrophobic membrane anchor protein, partial [Alphaproteobacteria bacterium]|nr:succinate dehydrogenase, hydrophobic membrane anchor protein [Alphaproteobacteria bacterium]